ncbi:hypothetical protein CLF_104111 [Clonorchis sinensis]|uniref:Syntenin-1 n=1 Tax=Clonorchis sinensis TaxID=79923 RepID=G7YB04_CLOSI|nr:hypothetical protein CLF_104111 [Clonorchis sinensis]
MESSRKSNVLRLPRLDKSAGCCTNQEVSTYGIPPNQSPTSFDPSVPPISVTNRFQSTHTRHSIYSSQHDSPDFITPNSSYNDPLFREVLQLQREILYPGGVIIEGLPSDFRQYVAFVDAGHRVWVAGWNNACKELHRLFHIGDQLVSINNLLVKDSKHAFQLFCHLESERENWCTLRLRRTPLAKSFAVRRVEPGQSVGVRLNQGTNEIRLVVPDGLVSKVGLSTTPELSLATYSLEKKPVDKSPQTWTVTEINGHAVNMFFTHGETEVLLNAYGSEMSFVVQPSDLIACLRQELKRFKSYKRYIP